MDAGVALANGRDDSATELWRHPNIPATQMWAFLQRINEKYALQLQAYGELYRWSTNNIALFWEEVWHFTGVRAVKEFDLVLPTYSPIFPRPDFFQGALLNFAENLLFPKNIAIDEDSLAVIEVTESGRSVTTWAQLRLRVAECADALCGIGIQPSDRIAGFLGNSVNAVIAMLGAASIGAIWTGVSPDTGVTAVLERLVQIEPKILFVDNAVLYNGKVYGGFEKMRGIVEGLKSLIAVVIFETIKGYETNDCELRFEGGRVWAYDAFLLKWGLPTPQPLKFAYLPPSHPLYILYSSGTTGPPKCIVHSAAGTLVQHKKEHILHCDIRPGDRVFYFTTTTWMMWHWLVSALASGATIVLYDGSPFHPFGNLTMPKLIQDLRINYFGTSAKYLSILEQNNVKPLSGPDPLNLSSLKAIYSTGSPLASSTFRYVYASFPSSLNLGSITGGTDIISLFGAPCSLLPVHPGEIQCAALGMDISALLPNGTQAPADTAGDLVCRSPFPSQPITFFGPSGSDKYFSSYFAKFPGVWHHGDFVRFSARTGGITMLGRSDGILKPAGVRFGSAEIYNLLLAHFAEQVSDAICVGRRREGIDTDEAVVLFLKMSEGNKCDEVLKEKVKTVVRKALSARHVPAIIDECYEIPVTGNGKKVEIAVKQILCGLDIKIGASVANKECLDWYREWAEKN